MTKLKCFKKGVPLVVQNKSDDVQIQLDKLKRENIEYAYSTALCKQANKAICTIHSKYYQIDLVSTKSKQRILQWRCSFSRLIRVIILLVPSEKG